MSEIVLSVGSNLKAGYVEKAIAWLESVLTECRASHIYTTPAVQGYGDPYTNAVVMARSDMDCNELNRIIKEYELSCGRDDNARAKGIVPIDIDIVVVAGEVLRLRDFNQSFFKIGYQNLLAR